MHVPMTHGWCDNIRVTSARVLTSSEMPKLRKNPRYFITHLGQQTEESQGWTKIIFSLRMMGFGVAKWSALAIKKLWLFCATNKIFVTNTGQDDNGH